MVGTATASLGVAPGKVVLDLSLDELCMQERILSKDIHICVRAVDKLCITGRNGIKSTIFFGS